MEKKTASTSHSQSFSSTNQKRKQLKKTKTLPIIKQTKTSMIRMVKANPLLLLHDKSKDEKNKLTGIQVPKSFDFQRTEEFFKVTYGLFQKMMPMKSTSLTNLKGKSSSVASIDKLPENPNPANNKKEGKNAKMLKSNKEIVKYYKSNNNNNTDNSKNKRNLKENVNSKQIQKGSKPFRKEHKNTIKKTTSQDKCLPIDKFDTKFMLFSVTDIPLSSDCSNFSPIPKDTNIKAPDRARCVFFSTPMLPKRQ